MEDEQVVRNWLSFGGLAYAQQKAYAMAGKDRPRVLKELRRMEAKGDR